MGYTLRVTTHYITKHSSKDDNQVPKPAEGTSSPNKQNSLDEIHGDHLEISSVSDDLFVGVEKRRIKRLYLGGVREGVTDNLISNYIKKKGRL